MPHPSEKKPIQPSLVALLIIIWFSTLIYSLFAWIQCFRGEQTWYVVTGTIAMLLFWLASRAIDQHRPLYDDEIF